MVKTLLIIVLLCSPVYALDLSEADKQKHLAVSAGLGLAADAYLYHYIHVKDDYRPFVAFSMALVPGLAKEAADDVWDNEDLAADAIGAGVGVLAGEVINRLFGPSKYLLINSNGVSVGGTW